MKPLHLLSLLVLLLAGSALPPAQAAPSGESVRAGAATFHRGPGSLTIHQTTGRLIVNWRDFSIAPGEVTRFIQPSSRSVALNRVTGGNPSLIYGSLEANGRVYLLNPAGILVGPGGRIDTHHFMGSTLEVDDASFLRNAGLRLSGNSTAPIRNEGAIRSLGGDVMLIARTIENAGTISAPQGKVSLAAATEVMLYENRPGSIAVLAGRTQGPSAAVGVNNTGLIEAKAAELQAAGGNIYALAINNGGVIRADAPVWDNGRLVLRSSGGNIQNSGTLQARNGNGNGGSIVVDAGHNAASPASAVNTGVIDARGDAAGSRGGSVQLTGDHVAVEGQGRVDVSGPAGGGQALIGGGRQGRDPGVQNAQTTTIGADASIHADALTRGDGGQVIVWSDEATSMRGSISARGGAEGGNGGFVETSGKLTLDLAPGPRVDARAPRGTGGTWFVDPADITIDNGSGDPNTIAAETISSVLDMGMDFIVNTSSGSGGVGNITVNAPITMTASGNAMLSLVADGGIDINASISSTVGNLSLNFDAQTEVNINAPLATLGGSLTVLARGGGIQLAAAEIGGTLTATANGNITDSGAVNVTGDARFTALGGDIILDQGGTSGTLSLLGNDAQVVQAGSISLKDSILTGRLTLESTSGGIVSANTIITGGDTVLQAQQEIRLTGAGSRFGTLFLTAPSATVHEAEATDLGQSTISGLDPMIIPALTINSAGPITQSGLLTVSGGSTFAISGGTPADILLPQANPISGTLTLAGNVRDAELRSTESIVRLALPAALRNLSLTLDHVGVTLPETIVTDRLSIHTGGDVTQGGRVSAGIADIDAQGHNVTLNEANDFGSFGVQGVNVQVTDQNGIDLAASTVSGNLTVKANGPITQSGVLTVNGSGATATFTATGAGNDITLDFGGDFATVGASGRNVTLRDSVNGFTLDTTTAAEKLDLQAQGDIVEKAGVVVTAQTLTASTTGKLLLGKETVLDGNDPNQNQNHIGSVGDVTTGALATMTTMNNGFYLYDSSDGLILNGMISASHGNITIRTVGALTLESSATVTLVQNGSGRSVALSAEGSSGDFHNRSGADAIVTAGGRYIIYLRAAGDNEPVSDPGGPFMSLGGLTFNISRDHRTFEMLPPNKVPGGGNAFIFADESSTPDNNETSKFLLADLAQIRAFTPFEFVPGAESTESIPGKWITTSSYEVYKVEQKMATKRRRSSLFALNGPGLEALTLTLNHTSLPPSLWPAED